MEQSEIFELFDVAQPEENTEPASGNTEEAADPPEGTAPETAEEPERKEEQSIEERRQQAAARRKREYDEAISRAREEGRKEAESRFADTLKKSNLENPMGGKKIETLEELEAYNEESFARQLERDLKDGVLKPEQLDRMIERNPVVKRLMEQEKALEAERNRAEEAERLSKARDSINEMISREISPRHPEVKVMEDLFELEEWPNIQERVNRGYSLQDAYYLAYREKDLAVTAQQAEKQGRQSVQGRSHLKATKAQGVGMKEVPADMKKNFLLFNPNATDDEIRAFYNKTLST